MIIDRELWALAANKLVKLRPASTAAIAHFVTAAMYAAEGLHYLTSLDDDRFGDIWVVDQHEAIVVQESHVRWATGSAITSIDLCAAVLGRVYGLAAGGYELSFRHLDSDRHAKSRIAKIDPRWHAWVSAVSVDPNYTHVLTIRNTFTHSDARREIRGRIGGGPLAGHADRGAFRLDVLDSSPSDAARAKAVEAKDTIDRARDLATKHVAGFIAVGAT